MKIFISNIILLVVLQKCGMVMTVFDVLKRSKELEDCPICKEEITIDLSKVTCCRKTFHFKCIDNWINIKESCPLCRQLPFEKCKICQKFLSKDVTNVKCCVSQFHQNCLDEWFTKKGYECPNCNKHFKTGVQLYKCKMCQKFLSKDVTNVKCCESQFHQNCLDEWFTKKGYECPNCNKHFKTGVDKCKICYTYLSADVTEVKCCNTKLHQECLDRRLKYCIMCLECNKDLISDYDKSLVCSKCKRVKKVNGENMVLLKCCGIYVCKDCIYITMKGRCFCGENLVEAKVVCSNCKYIRNGDDGNLIIMNCCGKKLCEFCIKHYMKTSCSCGEDLVKGIPFNDVRICTECEKNTGVYSFSPRCPHIFCEGCFTSTKNKYFGKCKYCGESEPNKSSKSFIKMLLKYNKIKK